MERIEFIKGHYDFLRNFYPSPFRDGTGITWATNEHFYQAMKTIDLKERAIIWAAATPYDAKKLGRDSTVREDWDSIKEEIMMRGLRYKFSNDSELAEMLLNTGQAEIVEKAPWDEYWGAGKEGTGQNRLGKLLMKRRSELQEYMAWVG